MATRASAGAQNMKTELDVCLGKAGTPVGKLVFVRNGPRVFTQFAYFQDWLDHADTFNVSPDLRATPGYQTRKPATKEDSLFFLALGDTEPDAWGRRVIARAHAKRREEDPKLGALTEWNTANVSAAFKEVLTEHGLKMPQLAMPVRVLVMGTPQTPSVDAVLWLCGKEKVLARLTKR